MRKRERGTARDGTRYETLGTDPESGIDTSCEREDVCPRELDRTKSRTGETISSEHGIGRTWTVCPASTTESASIEVMRTIKTVPDPNGALNLGAVLRAPDR